MNWKPLSSLAAIALLGLVTGCGSPPPEQPVAPPVTPEPKPTAAPAPVPEAPKGLGISQSKLMIGTGSLALDQAEMKTAEGNVYMGTTSDDATKNAKLIVYGSPDLVTHVLLVSNLPYADFPDAAKYPEFMQNNIKLQNTLLSNLFGGTIPEDVKAGLEWAKANPDKDKIVTVDKKTVKLTYGANKKMSIEVK